MCMQVYLTQKSKEFVYGVGTGKFAVHLTLEHGLVHFEVQRLDAAQQLTGL